MIYILDTDILTLLGREDAPESPRIRRRIAELPAHDVVVTTVINFEEQMRGWMSFVSKARTFREEVTAYAKLVAHVGTFRRLTILEFSDKASVLAHTLRSQRVRIGSMDLKISAIALSRNATVVTRNVVDFGQIPDLSVENWAETD
jgi:tRNA(fMet)-specific endonuclease VapC